MPVATCDAIAAGDAETTVSAKPPVEETTGSTRNVQFYGSADGVWGMVDRPT